MKKMEPMLKLHCYDTNDFKIVYRNALRKEGGHKRTLKGTKAKRRTIEVYIDGRKQATIEERNREYEVCVPRRPGESSMFARATNTKTVMEAKRYIAQWYEEELAESEKSAANPQMLPASQEAEFYPTPSSLAGRMIAKIDWSNVCTVLEPSAGKGDLLHALSRYADNYRTPLNRRGFSVHENVDVIERDMNLQFMLRGQGYRLIGDDFLTYHTPKHYDVILMNPPFSQADKHLIHALMMQENGGQICCLLNAETIRNPYTQLRQKLKQMLSDYHANIEFIQGAFAHAERPSNVEVAIVSVSIPRKRRPSQLLESLRKAESYQAQEQQEPTAMVSSDWIQRLIENYRFEVKAGTRLLEEYESIAPYIMSGTKSYSAPNIEIKIGDTTCNYRETEKAINRYLRCVRRKYWHEFLYHKKLEEVTGAMPSAMRSEYQDKVMDMENYEFDEYNIRQCILDMQLQINQGRDEAILALFDKLSAEHAYYPECEKNRWYYDGWKTNKAHKVGMKVIIPTNGCFAESWSGELLKSYVCSALLSDIEKTLDYLDRGQTAFHRSINMELHHANLAGKPKVETTYFTATFYKKGTCHIKFRPEAKMVIDRLNAFAGLNRNWLPPYYGKVRYEDMDAEGKAVIDSYQGKEEYEKVVADPGAYLPANTPLMLK